VVGKGPLRVGHLFFGTLEVHFYPDCRNPENAIDILDVSFNIGPVELLGRGDLVSGQQRGQCPHHSPRGCGYNVIEGCSILLFGFDLVEPLDPPVDAIIDRLGEALDHALRVVLSP
jgi:hypothetical protein